MLSSLPCKLWHSKRLIKIIAIIIIITIWYVHIYQYLEWSSSTLHNQRIHWLFIKHLLRAWCISQGQLGYFAITNIPIVSVTQNNKSHIDSEMSLLEAARVTFNSHFSSQNKSNGHFRGVERVWFYSEPEGTEQEEAAETEKESCQPAAPLGAWDVAVNKTLPSESLSSSEGRKRIDTVNWGLQFVLAFLFLLIGA